MAKKINKGEKEQLKDSVKTTGSVDNKESNAPSFVFNKENYILLGVGLALIIVGFLLMIGGGSDDPSQFSDEIFNFRRLTLAPILILAGYVVEVFAIMKKFKK